jgi:FSR family fosmidomycin resistance protein-like MFS transporter
MVLSVTSSLLQPLFGRWFDRTQTTWVLEAGLALNCVGMSLIGISTNYVILLFLVGSAGLGSAAFHPPAFSAVVRSSQSSRGGSMGIFLSGGNTGFFLGPIVAGGLMSSFGLLGTLAFLPIGIVVAGLLLRVRRSAIIGEQLATSETNQPANKRLVILLAPSLISWGCILRSWLLLVSLWLEGRLLCFFRDELNFSFVRQVTNFVCLCKILSADPVVNFPLPSTAIHYQITIK